jgi:DNA-binding XRE family transcriptional regulator
VSDKTSDGKSGGPAMMLTRQLNGSSVRVIRELLGIAQPDLALRVGLSRAVMSNIERRAHNVSPEIAVKIARALEVPLEAVTFPVVPAVVVRDYCIALRAEGMSTRQIALALHVSEQAVRSYLGLIRGHKRPGIHEPRPMLTPDAAAEVIAGALPVPGSIDEAAQEMVS